MKYDLSIVVPAYNEVKNLPGIVERYKKAKNKIKFQLVVVDNGSRDSTAQYLKNVQKNNKFVKVVTIKQNIGYGNGIYKGLRQCDANVIGWSHADLQCPPEDIFKGYSLLLKHKNKECFVKGNRGCRDWKPLILTYGLSIIATLILWKLFDDINGQPKLFSRELLNKFKKPPFGFSFDLYAQHTAKKHNYAVVSFPVKFEQRVYGISKAAYSFISRFSTIMAYIKDVLQMRVGIIR